MPVRLDPHSVFASESIPRLPTSAGRVLLLGTGGVCLPWEELLQTRALENAQASSCGCYSAVVRLCDHFEDRGSCNRGHKCRFAHRVATHPLLSTTATPRTTGSELFFTVPGTNTPASIDDEPPRRDVEASSPTRLVVRTLAAAPSTFSVIPGAAPRGPCVVKTSRGWRHAAYAAQPLSVES